MKRGKYNVKPKTPEEIAARADLNRLRSRLHYQNNKAAHLAAKRLWRMNNPDKVKAVKKAYYWNVEKAAINAAGKRPWNDYLKDVTLDPAIKKQRKSLYKSVENMMKKVRGCISGNSIIQTQKQMARLGCNVVEFMSYMENQFTDGMTWGNYCHWWEFDHIKPVSSFDLSDPTQMLAAAHYTNMRPIQLHLHKIRHGYTPQTTPAVSSPAAL